MRRPGRDVIDGAAGGDQRLADHLAAEHPLPARLRRAAAKQIQFERLEIENVEKLLDCGDHAHSPSLVRVHSRSPPIRSGVPAIVPRVGVSGGLHFDTGHWPGQVWSTSGGSQRATVLGYGVMTGNDVDVLIAGGGFAGLTLAIALRQALGPSFAVTVADPALGANRAKDERASAIVAGARRLFATIGVWDGVAGEAQPILDMVGDRQPARRRGAAGVSGLRRRGRTGRAVRPHDREPAAGRSACREGEQLRRRSASSRRAQIRTADGERVTSELTDGHGLDARLLVAADGARSTIRERGRHRHPWLELRPVGDRHQCRARARS